MSQLEPDACNEKRPLSDTEESEKKVAKDDSEQSDDEESSFLACEECGDVASCITVYADDKRESETLILCDEHASCERCWLNPADANACDFHKTSDGHVFCENCHPRCFFCDVFHDEELMNPQYHYGHGRVNEAGRVCAKYCLVCQTSIDVVHSPRFRYSLCQKCIRKRAAPVLVVGREGYEPVFRGSTLFKLPSWFWANYWDDLLSEQQHGQPSK